MVVIIPAAGFLLLFSVDCPQLAHIGEACALVDLDAHPFDEGRLREVGGGGGGACVRCGRSAVDSRAAGLLATVSPRRVCVASLLTAPRAVPCAGAGFGLAGLLQREPEVGEAGEPEQRMLAHAFWRLAEGANTQIRDVMHLLKAGRLYQGERRTDRSPLLARLLGSAAERMQQPGMQVQKAVCFLWLVTGISLHNARKRGRTHRLTDTEMLALCDCVEIFSDVKPAWVDEMDATYTNTLFLSMLDVCRNLAAAGHTKCLLALHFINSLDPKGQSQDTHTLILQRERMTLSSGTAPLGWESSFVEVLSTLGQHHMWQKDEQLQHANPLTSLVQWAVLMLCTLSADMLRDPAEKVKSVLTFVDQAGPLDTVTARSLLRAVMDKVTSDVNLVQLFRSAEALQGLVRVLQRNGQLALVGPPVDQVMANGLQYYDGDAAKKLSHMSQVTRIIEDELMDADLQTAIFLEQSARAVLSDQRLDPCSFEIPQALLSKIFLGRDIHSSHHIWFREWLARRYRDQTLECTVKFLVDSKSLLSAFPSLHEAISRVFRSKLATMNRETKFQICESVDFDPIHPSLVQDLKQDVHTDVQRACQSTAARDTTFDHIRTLVTKWSSKSSANLQFGLQLASELVEHPKCLGCLDASFGVPDIRTELLSGFTLAFADWYRLLHSHDVVTSADEASGVRRGADWLRVAVGREVDSFKSRTISTKRYRLLFSKEYRNSVYALFTPPFYTGFGRGKDGGPGDLEREISGDVEALRELKDTFHHFANFLNGPEIERLLSPRVRKELTDYQRLKRDWQESRLCDLLQNESLHLATRWPEHDIKQTIKRLQYLDSSKVLFQQLKSAAFSLLAQGMGERGSHPFVNHTPENRTFFSKSFKHSGRLEMHDVFSWFLESIFRAWDTMKKDLIGLSCTLDKVDPCFGIKPDTNRAVATDIVSWLDEELQILSMPWPDQDQQLLSDVQPLTNAIGRYLDLLKERNFLVDMKNLVQAVSTSKDGKNAMLADPEVKQLSNLANHLHSQWAITPLSESRDLCDQAKQFTGSMNADDRKFISLLCERKNIESVQKIRRELRRGARGAKWGFLRDGQKYANLQTQVQQGDEYTKQEAEYVDLLAEIREILLTLVFNHHGSLQSFLAELKQVRLNVNQDLIPKMAAAGHMAEVVQRISASLGMRTGARDVQSLDDVLKTGVWTWKQPESILGDPGHVANSTVTLVWESRLKKCQQRYNLPDAQDLRDRLFLENSDDEATAEGMNRFHEMLEAALQYARSLYQLYVYGFPFQKGDRPSEYTKQISMKRNTAEDVHRLCWQAEATLDLWQKGISAVRDQHAGLNFYTVRQVMKLAGDIHTDSDESRASARAAVGSMRPVAAAAEQGWRRQLNKRWDISKDYAQDPEVYTRQLRGFLECRVSAQDAEILIGSLVTVSLQTKAGDKRGDSLAMAVVVKAATDADLRKLVVQARRIAQDDTPASESKFTGDCRAVYEQGHDMFPTLFDGLALVEAVGLLLDNILEGTRPEPRRFRAPTAQRPPTLQGGKPNVVTVASPDDLLPELLSLYAHQERFPFSYEVQFCTLTTNDEKIDMLLRRCLDCAQQHYLDQGLFVLANVDCLAMQQQNDIVDRLERYSLDSDLDFRLILLCSSPQNRFSNAFKDFTVDYRPLSPEDQQACLRDLSGDRWHAAQLSPFIRVYTSELKGYPKVGLGKTYTIRRDVETAVQQLGIQDIDQLVSGPRSVPVGQTTDADAMVTFLRADVLRSNHTPVAFHMNITSADQTTDILLFRLLVLNNLEDGEGTHFSLRREDAIYIEIASDKGISSLGSGNLVGRLRFTAQLPTKVVTLQPGVLDHTIEEVQRVCKYLKELEGNGLVAERGRYRHFKAADELEAQVVTPSDDCRAVLDLYLPKSSTEEGATSVLDESMVMTLNFCKFLSTWLKQIETTSMLMAADFGMLAPDSLLALGKPDLRHKLVESLVETSRDYSSRCINWKSLLEEQLELFNLKRTASSGRDFELMKKWKERPLILPCVSTTGGHDAIEFKLLALDPRKVPNEVRTYWSTGFAAGIEGFSFQDYQQLISRDQQEGIKILCDVLNVKRVGSVHPFFVLTIDNIMKMLAVHFRVSSGIPVVIMGETGCGKTFSINYLARFQSIPFFKLDVHGGITDDDVLEFMNQEVIPACSRVTSPSIESGAPEQVWCFLDEINTCGSLGLFKEMICDGSMQGKILPANLVILAACNPYRKKPATSGTACGIAMTGGDTNANELVYVVQPLPETLYDYVWDYGTLNPGEERRYVTSMLNASFQSKEVHQTFDLEKGPDGFGMVINPSGEISSVSGGPAKAAGMPVGSRIMKVAGQEVACKKDILQILKEHKLAAVNLVQFECLLPLATMQQELEPEPELAPSADLQPTSTRNVKTPDIDLERLRQISKDDQEQLKALFADLVTTCHAFVRRAEGNEVSVVSLRDVARCIKLFHWFFTTSTKIRKVEAEDMELAAEDSEEPVASVDSRTKEEVLIDDATESMILAVAHCYHFRLQEEGRFTRCELRNRLKEHLRVSMLTNSKPSTWLEDVLEKKLQWFIDAMKPLPAGVADNAALKENVFMMLVCVLNKIAIMCVGKPGSSKTLATQLIKNALNNSNKKEKYDLVGFRSLNFFPYQCSEHSTAQDIEAVFKKAIAYEKQYGARSRAVVLLDEVGLAENAKAMPLKVLHKLLEEPKVGFIGLSNWTLDPAKMNRAVYLLRPEWENREDLHRTAVELVKAKDQGDSDISVESKELIAQLPRITEAYIELIHREKSHHAFVKRKGDNFTGLRDFYSFVKLLNRLVKRGQRLDSKLLLHATFRSFGGFREDIVPDIVAAPMWTHCDGILHSPGQCEGPEDIAIYRSRNILDLIRANLKDVTVESADGIAPSETGARHLMLLATHINSTTELLKGADLLDMDRKNPSKILCGSPFPDDQSTLTMFRRITQVRQCMELGKTIVLIQQDKIYASLYDMLNQNYSDGHAGEKLCHLAIGSRSRLCEVHPKFRCIVVVQNEEAWNMLPSPLLNRFEKLTFGVSDLLQPQFHEADRRLMELCEDFLQKSSWQAKTRRSAEGIDICQMLRSVFVGFNRELIPSALWRIQQECPECPVEQAVQDTQNLLLQLATPESIVEYSRTQNLLLGGSGTGWGDTSLNPLDIYFAQQQHSNLNAVILALREQGMDSAVVLTFSSAAISPTQHLPSFKGKTQELHLAEVKSEDQLRDDLVNYFDTKNQDDLLVVQCRACDQVSCDQIDRAKQLCSEVRAERRAFLGEDIGLRKDAIFLIHLEKESVESQPDGVLFPYLINIDSWRYILVDAVELESKQGRPAVHSMLSTQHLTDALQQNGRKLARQVLKHSFRRSLSRLSYPPNSHSSTSIHNSIHRQMQFVGDSLIKEDEDWLQTVLGRLAEIWEQEESESQATEAPWFATLSPLEIAKAGTFRGALFARIEDKIVGGFARLMSVMDRDSNLRVLGSSDAARELWLAMLKNEVLCPMPSPSQNGFYSVRSGRVAGSFEATFPFFTECYERIEKLYQSGVAHDLSQMLENLPWAQEVTKAKLQQHPSLLEDYVVSSVQMRPFTNFDGDWPEYITLAKTFVQRCAMDISGSPDVRDLADIHRAMHEVQSIAQPAFGALEVLRSSSKALAESLHTFLDIESTLVSMIAGEGGVIACIISELRQTAESGNCEALADQIEAIQSHMDDILMWSCNKMEVPSLHDVSTLTLAQHTASDSVKLGDTVRPLMEGLVYIRAEEWATVNERYAVLLSGADHVYLHLYPSKDVDTAASIPIAICAAEIADFPMDTRACTVPSVILSRRDVAKGISRSDPASSLSRSRSQEMRHSSASGLLKMAEKYLSDGHEEHARSALQSGLAIDPQHAQLRALLKEMDSRWSGFQVVDMVESAHVIIVDGEEYQLRRGATVADVKHVLEAATGIKWWQVYHNGQIVDDATELDRGVPQKQPQYSSRFATTQMSDESSVFIDWCKLVTHVGGVELAQAMSEEAKASVGTPSTGYQIMCNAALNGRRTIVLRTADALEADDQCSAFSNILMQPVSSDAEETDRWVTQVDSHASNAAIVGTAEQKPAIEFLATMYKQWQKLLLVVEFTRKVTQPLGASQRTASELWSRVEPGRNDFGSFDMFKIILTCVHQVDSAASRSREDVDTILRDFVGRYLLNYAFQDVPSTFMKKFVLQVCNVVHDVPLAALLRPSMQSYATNVARGREWGYHWSEGDLCCYHCERKFTTFSRKSHCRLCGRAFCTIGSGCKRLVNGSNLHSFNVAEGGKGKVCCSCEAVARALNNDGAADGGLVRTRSREWASYECFENQRCKSRAFKSPNLSKFAPTSGPEWPPYTEVTSGIAARFNPDRNKQFAWDTSVDHPQTTDAEGWEYAPSFTSPATAWGPEFRVTKPKTWVRRRRHSSPLASVIRHSGGPSIVRTDVDDSASAAAHVFQDHVDDSQILRPQLIEKLVRLVQFEKSHCSTAMLLEGGLKHVSEQLSHADTELMLLVVEAIEDTLMAQLPTADSSTGQLELEQQMELEQQQLLQWCNEILQDHLEIALPRRDSVKWAYMAARCRIIVSKAATCIIQKRLIGQEEFFEKVGRLLSYGLVPDQARSLQLLLAKYLAKHPECGMQDAFRLLTTQGTAAQTFHCPALSCPHICADITSAMQAVDSTTRLRCAPAFDPLHEMSSDSDQYLTLASQALPAFGVNDNDRHVALTRLQRSSITELVMTVFDRVYVSTLATTGSHDARAAVLDELSGMPGMDMKAKQLLKMLVTQGSRSQVPFLAIHANTQASEVLQIRPAVHMAAVCIAGTGQGSIFAELLNNAASFEQRYLPVQPQDELLALLATQKDVAIYKCPNGHPYVVDHCTRTDQAATCECGAPIGNAVGEKSHTLAAGNQLVGYTNAERVNQGEKKHDLQLREAGTGKSIVGGVHLDTSKGAQSMKGYGLDHAMEASEKLQSMQVRTLSSVTTRVLRYLLHGLLLLSYGTDLVPGQSRESVQRLLGSRLAVSKLTAEQFLQQHVTNDFEVLQKLLSCSVEDLSVRLHLYIMQFAREIGSCIIQIQSMNLEQQRDAFEIWFQQSVVQAIDGTASARIVSIRSFGTNVKAIQREIDEDPGTLPTDPSTRHRQTPLLLRYRKQPSWRAFVECIYLDSRAQQRCPVLANFVKQKEALAVHRHMPQIVAWLRLVKTRYNKKIGRDEAGLLTVKQVLDQVEPGDLTEWQSCWDGFRIAWAHFRGHVKAYECTTNFQLPEMTENSVIAMSMPSEMNDKPSIYPLALLQWWKNSHNKFLEHAHDKLRTLRDREVVAMRRMWHSLQPRDYVDFKPRVLQRLITSYALQPLEYGRGSEMSFDFSVRCTACFSSLCLHA